MRTALMKPTADIAIFSRMRNTFVTFLIFCLMPMAAFAQTSQRQPVAQSLEELEEQLMALEAREQAIKQQQNSQQREPQATQTTNILDESEEQIVRPGGDTYILDQEEAGTGDTDILDSQDAVSQPATYAAEPMQPATQPAPPRIPPAPKDNSVPIIVLSVCFGGAFLLIIGALIIWLKPSRPKRAAPAEPSENLPAPPRMDEISMPESIGQDMPAIEALAPLSEEDDLAFPQSPSRMEDDFSAPLIDEEDIHTQVYSTLSQASWLIKEGNVDKAKETVEEHLTRLPTNQELIMKLLEIHKLTNDTGSFNSLAEKFQGLLQDQYQDWGLVIQWGHELDPENPLYTDANAPATTTIQTAAQAVSSPPPAFEEDDANIYAAPSTPPRAAQPTKDDPFAGIPMQDDQDPEMTFDQGLAAMREEMEKLTGVPSPLPDMLNDPWAEDDDANNDDPFFDFDNDIKADPFAATEPAAIAAPSFNDSDIFTEADPLFAPEASTPSDILENEPAFTADSTSEPALTTTGQTDDAADPFADTPSSIAKIPQMNLEDTPPPTPSPTPISPAMDPNLDEPMKVHFREIESRLALVTAYENMGDMTGARELLMEIINTSKIPEQKAVALEKLQDLGG